MDDLTVVTVVENDNGLLDLMMGSVYKFTNPAPKIIICAQGNGIKTVEKYNNDKNITIVKNNPKVMGGSNRHGLGLNHVFNFIKTKRAAIIESDCIVLNSGWDNIENQYKMVAAKKVQDQNIYHVCFLLFYYDFLKSVDFLPGNGKIVSGMSYPAKQDVGHKIADTADVSKIKLAKFVDCKSGNGKFFDGSFQSDEIWVDDLPIIAHFGRGSCIGGKAVRKGFKSPKEQLQSWKDIANKIIY